MVLKFLISVYLDQQIYRIIYLELGIIASLEMDTPS